jgi:hypothetical protein
VLRNRTSHGRSTESGATSVVNPKESAGGLVFPPRDRRNGRARRVVKPASALFLSPDEWAALRNRLVGEIADLQSQESATSWAEECWPPRTASMASRLVDQADWLH